MSYAAWSVVFGEQPSAAKWNILGANDASFNDGSGFNISNPVTAASTSHLELTPGTNKFVKIAVLRQSDTTNAYKNKSVILTGWGVITPGVTGAASEAVTFGITFDQLPIVVACSGGDNAASTTYGQGGFNIKKITCEAASILTTGFTPVLLTVDSTNWAAGNTVFYQWIAIGEVTA